ncbi:hypothetical protein ACT7DE_17480 [Bacillus paranthracis]
MKLFVMSSDEALINKIKERKFLLRYNRLMMLKSLVKMDIY